MFISAAVSWAMGVSCGSSQCLYLVLPQSRERKILAHCSCSTSQFIDNANVSVLSESVKLYWFLIFIIKMGCQDQHQQKLCHFAGIYGNCYRDSNISETCPQQSGYFPTYHIAIIINYILIEVMFGRIFCVNLHNMHICKNQNRITSNNNFVLQKGEQDRGDRMQGRPVQCQRSLLTR